MSGGSSPPLERVTTGNGLLSPNLVGCGSKSWKGVATEYMMRRRAKSLTEKGAGGPGWVAWLLGPVPQAS